MRVLGNIPYVIVSSARRQKGLSMYLNTNQLEPFASKLMIYRTQHRVIWSNYCWIILHFLGHYLVVYHAFMLGESKINDAIVESGA